MKMPKNIVHSLTPKIETVVEELLYGTEYWDKFKKKNFACFVTDTRRGRSNKTNLTVPLWAYDGSGTKPLQKTKYYFIYYVAHELSHIFARGYGHKASFYRVFKKICPKYLQKCETGYKSSSVAYGVSL